MSAIGHTDIISVSTKTGGNGIASMAPINTNKKFSDCLHIQGKYKKQHICI
jgi:hypothetical protein